jgi:hypothetical protein
VGEYCVSETRVVGDMDERHGRETWTGDMILMILFEPKERMERKREIREIGENRRDGGRNKHTLTSSTKTSTRMNMRTVDLQ